MSGKEVLCLLHTKHSCSDRNSYTHECSLRFSNKYAVTSCQYRIVTVELQEEEKVEEEKTDD